MKNKSFTLIELLVVIVIIGILAGVIMISTSSSIDKANIAKAKVFSESTKNNLMLNLVSEWHFDNGSGLVTASQVLDTWGSNNAQSISGSPQFKSESECISGTCIDFHDGDYFSVGSKSDLTFADQSIWTFEFWIFPREGFWNTIVGSFNNDYGPYIMFPHWDTDAYFKSATSSYYAINNMSGITLNKWHHVIYSCEGSTRRINVYINGVKKGGITSDNSSIRFSYFSNTAGRSIDGLMDEIRAYNTLLSSSQIKQNYIAGLDSLLSKGGISKADYNKRINGLTNNLTLTFEK